MRRLLAVLVLSTCATLVMTWPVGRHLADHLVVPRVFIGRGLLPTSPDTYLHLWILAWVHRALATDPARLFDANIMYPAEDALAGSEHMLAHWPVHSPVYAATGNPVLAYQWVLFSSFVLNAAALFALVRRWTGSTPGAAVGALVYAFCPLRFDLIGTEAILPSVLAGAAALGSHSRHPYSLAVVAAARTRNLTIPTADDTAEVPGSGLRGTIDGSDMRLGSAAFCGVDAPAVSTTVVDASLWPLLGD